LTKAEIHLRGLLSVGISANLIREIDDLTNRILPLLPPNDWTPDLHRDARAQLEQRREDARRLLMEEQRNEWNDVRPLRQEARQLLRERTEELQDYEWMTDLYDPGPH
jgi:hypothetical protein